MRKVIAIDGPSGVGKSSVARGLATNLHWTYLDTGAMYRTVTLAWMKQGSQLDRYSDPNWLTSLDLDFQEHLILLDGEDVSQAIRRPEINASVSQVSASAPVRTFLTDMQRLMAGRRPCILDGRDIGTVVFPDAFLKVFLTASPEVRARRRWLQMGGTHAHQTLAQVFKDQEARDQADRSRETAPLKQAADAFMVDTDRHSQEEVVALILAETQRRLTDLEGL